MFVVGISVSHGGFLKNCGTSVVGAYIFTLHEAERDLV